MATFNLIFSSFFKPLFMRGTLMRPRRLFFNPLPMTKKEPALIWPQNVEALEKILRDQRIPLAQWGVGSAKTVENLWQELQTGDSHLQLNPLRRRVDAATIIIQRDDKILIEVAQTLQGQRSRPRHWPPSEKIRDRETPRQAAARCLCEELELTADMFTLSTACPEVVLEQQISLSYPGLMTAYRFYVFDAVAPSLPDHPFQTAEQSHDDSDPVKTHSWVWGEARGAIGVKR